MNTPANNTNTSAKEVLQKIEELFHALMEHDGYGDLRLEVRILKRKQKEVIVHCGKQYRYVLDCSCPSCRSIQLAHKPDVPPALPGPDAAHRMHDFQ